MQIWWSNPYKMSFFGRSVTQIFFFQEMCSSGGKQTIHKVSTAFIVKNCHPRTSLKQPISPFKKSVSENSLIAICRTTKTGLK